VFGLVKVAVTEQGNFATALEVYHRLLVKRTKYSAIPVMSVTGIHVYLAEGSVDGDRFSHYVTEYLLSVLLPFNGTNPCSIMIMDNASIHHVDTNVQLIENSQAKVITSALLFP